MENQTFELTLKLSLPAKTLKKLKSYAMLSGVSVDELEKQLVSQVEPELSAHFDDVLTKGIVSKLGELDGVELSVAPPGLSESPPEGHQLSQDDDVGETKSLEELRQEAVASGELSEQSFDINVPIAGGNGEDAESFVEAAMTSKGRATQGPVTFGSMTSIRKSFDPKRPRVKISEHTGEEEGYFA